MDLAVAGSCVGGPWIQTKGQGQIIVNSEQMRADQGFDPDGNRVALPADRRDGSLSAFIEQGLPEDLTLQFKAIGSLAKMPSLTTKDGGRWKPASPGGSGTMTAPPSVLMADVPMAMRGVMPGMPRRALAIRTGRFVPPPGVPSPVMVDGSAT